VALPANKAAHFVAQLEPEFFVQLTDIHDAIALAYYLWHREAVDTYVAERAALSAAARAAHEAHFDPTSIRAGLLPNKQMRSTPREAAG
jgi:hypothetical protein